MPPAGTPAAGGPGAGGEGTSVTPAPAWPLYIAPSLALALSARTLPEPCRAPSALQHAEPSALSATVGMEPGPGPPETPSRGTGSMARILRGCYLPEGTTRGDTEVWVPGNSTTGESFLNTRACTHQALPKQGTSAYDHSSMLWPNRVGRRQPRRGALTHPAAAERRPA